LLVNEASRSTFSLERVRGSHYRVTFDGRISTVQSGELTPLMMRTIKKQLGIEER